MGKNVTYKRLLALAMAVICVGCSKPDNAADSSRDSGALDTEQEIQLERPDRHEQLDQAQAINSDVVAWLTLPNMDVDEAVVQTVDNTYYLRRNIEKKNALDGCYFMDYESLMSDNGAKLSQNTIIYGHNLGVPRGVKDDPEGTKFAQLLKLTNEDTAKNTPYVFLTTPAGQHVFQIFAAFYCEARLTPVPYHYASYEPERLAQLIADAKSRSEFSYDVPADESDSLLTLSTCTYKFGTYSQNNQQRFVVMARLVRDGERFAQTAPVKKNPQPKQPQFTGAA